MIDHGSTIKAPTEGVQAEVLPQMKQELFLVGDCSESMGGERLVVGHSVDLI